MAAEDSELEQLIRQLYAYPSSSAAAPKDPTQLADAPEADKTRYDVFDDSDEDAEAIETPTDDPERLRSGLSDELVAKLAQAVQGMPDERDEKSAASFSAATPALHVATEANAKTLPEVSNVVPLLTLRRRRWIAAAASVALAAAIAWFFLCVPPPAQEAVVATWQMEAKQQLAFMRGADVSTASEPAAGHLPVYGPESRIELIFRSQDTEQASRVAAVIVFRKEGEAWVRLGVEPSIGRHGAFRTLTIRESGRRLLGEAAGRKMLALALLLASPSPHDTDYDVLKARSDVAWLTAEIDYRTPAAE
ncbi:MAG: hypothetical protein AAFV29_10100 [Myxococcota bacterium]